MARDAGYDAWYKFLLKTTVGVENPDRPVLYAWKLTSSPGWQNSNSERNPYYWKVDPDGNQLPYIDRLSYETLTDTQVQLEDLVENLIWSIGWSCPLRITLYLWRSEKGDMMRDY